MIRLSMSAAAAFAFISTTVAYADIEEPENASVVSPDAPDAWQPEDGDMIKFDVFRQGDKEFGTHTVTFNVASEGNFTATSKVNLKAGLGPITVFKYTLDATEIWKNGKLVALDGQTNDDGTKETVRAEADGETLQVEGTGYTGEAPIGIIPSSHCDPAP